MSDMVYKWKPYVSIPVKAQVAGEEIDRIISDNDGSVTPKVVVREASKKRSPLHPVFEWNDRQAAISYREDQARYLLRSLVVVMENEEDESETIEVRAFVHLESEETYAPVVRVMAHAETRDEVLQRAWKELQEWRKKYDDLVELSKVIDTIDSMSA